MAELIRGLDASVVRANLARVREEIAGDRRRDPASVEMLAAVKYVALEELGVARRGRDRRRGREPRAGPRGEGAPRTPSSTWDFIGHLQSRKVKQVLPLVRCIHSVASDSVLRQLERHGTPETEVLVEVNIAGEEGKSGVAPASSTTFIARCPVARRGPDDDAAARRRTRRTAAAGSPPCASSRASAGCAHLCMGTTQDYVVAVEEGATIVRLGTTLYR